MTHVEIRRVNDDELEDWPALAGFWRMLCDCGATSFAPSKRTANIWAGVHLEHFHARPMSRQFVIRNSEVAPPIKAAAKRTKKQPPRTHRSVWTVSGGLPTLGKRR